MKANKELVDSIILMLAKGIISANDATMISRKLIDEICWDRIEVDESEDGEIVFMLSVIEDVDEFKGDFAELRKVAMSPPVRKSFFSPTPSKTEAE